MNAVRDPLKDSRNRQSDHAGRSDFSEYWKEHADEARRYRRNRVIFIIIFSLMIVAGIAIGGEWGAILIFLGGALLILPIMAALQWANGGPDPNRIGKGFDSGFDVDISSHSSGSSGHSSGGFGSARGGGGFTSGGGVGRGR